MIGALVHRISMYLTSGEPSLWQELWEYLEGKYFSVDMGRYEYIDVGSGSLINIRNVILGIFAGVVVAAAFASYDKNKLGGFVRALVRADCLSADRAKTIDELGYGRSAGVRGSLKHGTVLSKVVRCVEREAYDRDTEAIRAAYIEKNGSDKGFKPPPFVLDFKTAHFYIPDEEHYAAEVRFEEKGSGWRAFLLVVIVAIVGAIMVCFLLPEMLQLVDNMIGILKGEGNVLN